MKICNFEVISNGMTNKEYGSATFTCPPENECYIFCKRPQVSFIGTVDCDKNVIEVTENTYQKLIKLNESKNLENKKWWYNQLGW